MISACIGIQINQALTSAPALQSPEFAPTQVLLKSEQTPVRAA
jgi:hypothetical protein